MHMIEISKVYTYAEIKTTLKLSHQIWVHSLDFEVSHLLGLWFYLTNSLILFM